jgi:predicted nucleotide-binding protein
MVRRSASPKPERPNLTVDQKRRCITRIERSIADLEVFDPQRVEKRYGVPEVLALEAGIDEALSAAFGHKTPAYERYSRAATLDHGPHTARMSSDWGGSGNYDAQDAHEARQYFAEGKALSIVLLRQAIRALEDEIQDQEPPSHETAHATAARQVSTRKVFVVHGHGGIEHAVAGFLRKLGLEPVILREQANEGRTIIEKFEAHSDVGFAVILMTPDDVGSLKDGPQRSRARQNVILELGYFVGRLGRKKVCPLIQGDIELPSDVLGVAWVALDAHDGWHMKLARELQAAGYGFDFNKVLG